MSDVDARPPVAHVMKLSERAGQVKIVSVAFDGPRGVPVAAFKHRLAGLMGEAPEVFGPFEVSHTRRRVDWMILFSGTCPENELDDRLRTVATELDVLIFLEPAVPRAEVGIEPKTFYRTIVLGRDQPSNLRVRYAVHGPGALPRRGMRLLAGRPRRLTPAGRPGAAIGNSRYAVWAEDGGRFCCSLQRAGSCAMRAAYSSGSSRRRIIHLRCSSSSTKRNPPPRVNGVG